MKKLKTKWTTKGEEIDAFVNIDNITVRRGRYPGGRSGGMGSPGGPAKPPEGLYGSIIEYSISTDADGKNIISRGQMIGNFDMGLDGLSPMQDFAKTTLKTNKHLKNMREED